MGDLALAGATSGTITLTPTAVAGSNTLTLPASTGTVMVSGNMPAFSAYQNSGQSITANVSTKVTFDTEEYDTNNNFASSRFTPTVAGYYQLNTCVAPNSSNIRTVIEIYKNGSPHKRGIDITNSSSTFSINCSTLVNANGTTDYFEVYIFISNSVTLFAGDIYTYFNGVMVRSN